MKVLFTSFIIALSLGIYGNEMKTNHEKLSIKDKGYISEKPVPDYTIDDQNMKIIFRNVFGSYMIDNDHIDVVMTGKLNGDTTTVDFSRLEKGHYILEIEHKGYMFVEDLTVR